MITDPSIWEVLLRNPVAMFGLMAYPMQGVYKSIRSSGRTNIADTVRAGKIASYERYVSLLESGR